MLVVPSWLDHAVAGMSPIDTLRNRRPLQHFLRNAVGWEMQWPGLSLACMAIRVDAGHEQMINRQELLHCHSVQLYVVPNAVCVCVCLRVPVLCRGA